MREELIKDKQKFQRGDYVKITKDLGVGMGHFTSDCEAIIIGSYADQFGGSDIKSYKIFIKGGGEVSWYHEWQLELIEKSRIDILEKWEKEEEEKFERESSIDWIFQNGKDVAANPSGASIQGLANCIKPNFNLWGSRGEGYVYYQNVAMLHMLASPFLINGDKQGWIEFVQALKREGVC